MEWIAFTLTALTAIGAGIAAIGSSLSARATKRATQAQLLLRFLEEYSNPKMSKALVQLRKWKATLDLGTTTFEQFVKYKDSWGVLEKRVNSARRQVKYYFVKALRLHQEGLITQQLLQVICNVDGIDLLYDVVEPLERELNPDYEKEAFIQLREVCPRLR